MRFRRLLILSLCLFLLLPLATFIGGNNHRAWADTDTVAVTGQVLAHPTDFQSEIAASPTSGIGQNNVVTFTVKYGSRLLYTDQITVEAKWLPGKPDGSSPVDIFEYISGSASTAYGATPPVIDLVNQKISWTIPALPANTTNQTVTFQLKTNSNYTGSNTVSLPVSTQVVSRTVSSADATVLSSYTYQVSTTSDSTASPTPSPTPTPVSSPSPTSSLAITASAPPVVNLKTLLDKQFSLNIQNSVSSSLQVLYGTKANALLQSQADDTFAKEHNIVLSDLLPDTTYYVQVVSTDTKGTQTKSDIYQFKTAITSIQPVVLAPSLLFLSDNGASLYSGNISDPAETDTNPVIVLPQNTVYGFSFQVSKSQSIKKVLVIVRNAQVLGATTESTVSSPNELSTQLIETKDGIYQGNLKTPTRTGKYEVLTRIYDLDGNIVENKIADLNVSAPFGVFDKETQQPIEKGEVLISYFSQSSQSYVLLPPQLFSGKNPDYTDLHGQLKKLVLPKGKYKVKVTALGYKQTETMFNLGSKDGQGYPQILSEREPFNALTSSSYYLNTFQDAATQTKSYLQSISNSNRFFELNAIVVICLMVILTIFAFAARLHVPVYKLPSYLFHRARILNFRGPHKEYITGQILNDESSSGLASAEIFLLDNQQHKVVAHTMTNSQGKFTFLKALTPHYSFEIMADGFEPTLHTASLIESNPVGVQVIRLQQKVGSNSLLFYITNFLSKLLSFLFEALLIISFLFEFSLGFVLGWQKAAPFLFISLVNVCLWIVHLTHEHIEQYRER